MRNLVLSLITVASLTFSAEHVAATGRVVDADGKAVEHAAVLVYSAGVKKGYSVFCPTCYVDCGKRAFTGADGSYTIPGLSADLKFNLLVVKDGFGSKFVEDIDPVKGPSPDASMKARVVPSNPSQTVRGKVVDREGAPVRDALIEQSGAIFPDGGQMYGAPGWIDLIAVSNEKGEFEFSHTKPLTSAILQISPRGMASKLATLHSGLDRKTVTVMDGATIRGRLLQKGKPVANVEVGLSSHSRMSGEFIPEVRIGTDADGRFAFTNVPAGRIWYLYGKMDSLGPQGLVADIIECATKDNGQEVNLGDINVKPAYALRGKVVLSDGKPIPANMRLLLSSDRVMDSQNLVLAEDGTFEFKGLDRGVYSLSPAVKGYQLGEGRSLELLIEGADMNNLTIALQPAAPRKR